MTTEELKELKIDKRQVMEWTYECDDFEQFVDDFGSDIVEYYPNSVIMEYNGNLWLIEDVGYGCMTVDYVGPVEGETK